ncbi:vWA domain-containing protein [Nocardia abscessus]|uniref:vWA domain-containing protein n=1 Tax=Nocardia abscessus TaxID=120957 RepID=UPI0024590533|nr:vWA domain-containing protein [Nocardia abscessus]
MSHIVGTVQTQSPVFMIGPDSGPATDPPDTWTLDFGHDEAPTGTKLLILHFANASLPAANRLEVDLGYGGADSMDVFTAADGTDFWTRPINVAALPDRKVPIHYIRNGGGVTGSVTLDRYGRGERHTGDLDPSAESNCDPFLLNEFYIEPVYDPFWFCSQPPIWEDINCVPDGDIRRAVARSVGMLIHVATTEHQDPNPEFDILVTCSVTLIGPDLVLTAGHCLAEEEVPSSSVIFNYAVDCPGGDPFERGGARPAGYAGRFIKVEKVIAQHYNKQDPTTPDYCLFQLAAPPDLPAIQLRRDLPEPAEQVFGIHHPNGAVKKLSVPHNELDPGSDFAQIVSRNEDGIQVPNSFHVSGGSSGSGLFDAAGRITGVLAAGNPCANPPTLVRYYPTHSIIRQIATAPPTPVTTRDVMIVIDRSGSMSMTGASGRTKIEEARDAASLFVQLVRADTGNKLGLVSFSTTPSLDFHLQDANGDNKTTLIGLPPFSGGMIGGLIPDGTTTIGGGLELAGSDLAAGGTNPRTILLLTDGLQNTPPMIDQPSVQSAINGIDLTAIGYGTESSLDGDLLTVLTTAHNGSYTQANSSLQLEKFFAQAFGNIFESGFLTDPEFVMAEDQRTDKPFPFAVCEEETVTIVVGWDNLDTTLFIDVTTPSGTSFGAGAPGTESATGRSWTFLRIPLPHDRERDGAWSVTVFRPGGDDEFPPPAPQTRYFVTVVANGGAVLTNVSRRETYYTGDPINPMVSLAYGGGGSPRDATVRLTVTRPVVSVGNLLSQERLHAPVTVGADTIPARQAALQAIEARTGQPAITHTQVDFDLSSGSANTNGAFEPHGLFGKPLTDLLTVEGNYTFHAVATYGSGCVATRELQWSVHVNPSVDPTRTSISTTTTGTQPDGTHTGTITITPRDPFGNNVGPGRSDRLTVTAGPGTTVTGPLNDNRDGSYTVPVTWTPDSGNPTVVIGQPGRAPVVVGGAPKPPADRCRRWKLLTLILVLLAIILFLLWLFK